jgi:hypothetical protein
MELQMENSISINQVHLQSPTKLLELISDSLERKRKSSLLVNLILSGIIMTLSIKVSLMSLKEPHSLDKSLVKTSFPTDFNFKLPTRSTEIKINIHI